MARSAMTHSFAEVPRANIPRSSFDRSHRVLTTFDADYLIPVLIDDVVPGDTFNCNMNFFARLATPLYPIMDNIFLESFAFFIPYRLIWENWTKMHGAQDDPSDSIDFTVPQFNLASGTMTEGSIWDYFGVPTKVTSSYAKISTLPGRAYNLIWNEWFRDQNLQDSVIVRTGDSGDLYADVTLLKRGKRHDYFTGCLPWPQKGDAVSIPLGGTADVHTAAAETASPGIYSDGSSGYRLLDSNNPLVDVSATTSTADTNKMYANLASATNVTISELRLAFQTQRLLERDARSGTRYNELILAHFGVTVPDFRIQRPEFLGGGSSVVNVNPVANTSSTATENQGDLAAFGTVAGSHGWTKSFTEHGIVMVLLNGRADITYSQGLERYWSKNTRFDFYYPVLSNIGEQSVLKKEIYVDGAAADDEVFGYQERYAEYRYKPSRLTGLFRPNATASLEAWHLSEEFSSRPTLGDTFIQSNTSAPLDRAIAVPTEPHFIADIGFSLRCARPMPLHGVPGNLDHF